MSILDEFKKGIVTTSSEETIAKAQALANFIPIDHTIALHGILGAGKTTFIKGLAKAWDIREVVTSPSFNLFLTYRGTRNLLHLDAFRLENEHQTDSMLLEEFLISPYCLVIEWPEKIEKILPNNTWHLYLSIDKNHNRVIKLRA